MYLYLLSVHVGMYTYEHDKYAKPPDQTTYHPQVTFPLCHMEGISQHGMQP